MRTDLSALIKKAMLSQDKIELETLRAIKTKFSEFTTSKGSPVLNDAEEVKILNKMAKERIETATVYSENNRLDLAEKELAEAEVIKRFLPIETSKEEIEAFVDTLDAFSQKEMGLIIKRVKEHFTNADGKIVADVVKTKITL